MTVKQMATEIETGQCAVQEMVGILGYQKVPAHWIPGLLTEEYKHK